MKRNEVKSAKEEGSKGRREEDKGDKRQGQK